MSNVFAEETKEPHCPAVMYANHFLQSLQESDINKDNSTASGCSLLPGPCVSLKVLCILKLIWQVGSVRCKVISSSTGGRKPDIWWNKLPD